MIETCKAEWTDKGEKRLCQVDPPRPAIRRLLWQPFCAECWQAAEDLYVAKHGAPARKTIRKQMMKKAKPAKNAVVKPGA